jgi:hypothetical protein
VSDTTYKQFRNNLSLHYADNIYAEIRGDKLYYHQITDGFWTVQKIVPILSKLESFVVTHDDEMIYFRLYQQPFHTDNFQLLTELEYTDHLLSLGGEPVQSAASYAAKYPSEMPLYSLWRYKLKYAIKCRDVDYLEIRQGEVRAVIETTGKLADENHLRASADKIFERLAGQRLIFKHLADVFSCPAYFVLHTRDLTVFYVYDIDFKHVLSANKKQYISFLESL